MNNDVKEGCLWGAGGIAAFILGFLLVIAVASMAVFGWGFFKRSTADFRGKTAVIERTKASADFRIQAYERFFDQCASIQALDIALNNSYTELASAPETDKTRIQINITGQLNSRAIAVTVYNADSRKEWTQAQFKDASLPYQISLNYQKGEVVSCGA